MNWLRHHKGVFLIFTAVIFILGLSLFSLLAGGGAMPISNAVGAIIKPFQNLSLNFTNSVQEFKASFGKLDELTLENEELRKKIAEYEQNEREFQFLQDENSRLKTIVGLKERRPELIFEDASIIAKDLSNWSKTFTISRGSNVGLAKGQCVITAEGYLVGIISEVGLNWSVATSIIDTEINVGSIVYRTGLPCVAEGNFVQMQNGKLKLCLLPLEVDIIKGDAVLTSGIGVLYPKDIPIGTVDEVLVESDGLSAMAVITPYANLENLSNVFVITSFNDGT